MEAPAPEKLELNESNMIATGVPTEEKEVGQTVSIYKNSLFNSGEAVEATLGKKILSTDQRELWSVTKGEGEQQIQTWIKKEPLGLVE